MTLVNLRKDVSILMSKSRLEKFLYALYSLDSSDLPKPLSRIEELYKCLVTGEEAPTFEPLSRVEKYLMSILGVYDVDSLPNPLSRVEVLLYKLATGDDNLDDVKSFLSEHEELLAEIIRNGGVGGNIDIEYVLYTLSTEFSTLYNTAKKPVKSAILKGNTLVNLLSESNVNVKSSNTYRINYTHDLNTTKTYILQYRINQISELSDTTDSARLLKFEWYSGNEFGGYSDIFIKDITVGTNNFIIINPFSDEVTKTFFAIWCPNYVSGSLDMDIILIEYQDGMENWDIPYFEGVQSVKMPVLTTTGKNLFDGKMELGSISSKGKLEDSNKCLRSTNFIKLKPSTPYTITNNLGYTLALYEYDSDFNFIKNTNFNKIYTTSENVAYIKIKTSASKIETDIGVKFQIEEGYVGTSYEPFKSNILTVNEPVELRGIGEVKDELDLMTGELTERIGKVVLDGSGETIYGHQTTDTETLRFFINCFGYDVNANTNVPFLTNTNLPNRHVYDIDEEGIFSSWGGLFMRISKTRLMENSAKGLKNYLQSNPITVQYQLATESVKTVDLSVVDQDGNSTKLSTFNDITHVTLSSEGLIPEAELEVATKNEEDLEDSSVYTTHTLSEEFNTLYNTAEKPVKSAILKGQTLVNLFDGEKMSLNEPNHYTYSNGIIKSTGDGQPWASKTNMSSAIKPMTKYLLKVKNIGECNLNVQIRTDLSTLLHNQAVSAGQEVIKIIETGEKIDGLYVKVYPLVLDDSLLAQAKINIIEYQDGMENWDIPYFEGMQSVKVPVLTITGKNLMRVNHVRLDGITSNSGSHPQNLICTNIPVVEGKTYRISGVATHSTNITRPVFYRFEHSKRTLATNHQQLYREIGKDNPSYTFTVPQGIHYVSYTFGNQVYTNDGTPAWLQFDNIILEEPSTTTEYEPYKSNILTVNEEVELRGIGDVKDELDLITGKLTQRVGEVVLDGSQDGLYDYVTEVSLDLLTIGLPKIPNMMSTGSNIYGLLSDKYVSVTKRTPGNIYSYNGRIMLAKSLSELESFNTPDKIKSFLSQNPITVQYPLATPIIKTVDLSVVDQDGNSTKLSTFNDITHVTLSSEGLIPEAELEVAEKVPEVAASMLTISREQEVINATTNEQSENVDSTMIATTEIYEELL